MNTHAQEQDLRYRAHQPWALDWDGKVLSYTGRHAVPWRRDANEEVIPNQKYKHLHCAGCGKAVEEWFQLASEDGLDYEELGWRFREFMWFPAYGEDPDRTTETIDTWDDNHRSPVWRLMERRPEGGPWPGSVATFFCSTACARAWIEKVLDDPADGSGWWCGMHVDIYRPDLTDEEYEVWREWCNEPGRWGW